MLGKFYGDFAHHQYFLMLTGLLGASAVLVAACLGKLNRFAG